MYLALLKPFFQIVYEIVDEIQGYCKKKVNFRIFQLSLNVFYHLFLDYNFYQFVHNSCTKYNVLSTFLSPQNRALYQFI